MAIHTEQVQEVSGFQKEIEASAMGMMFDILQKSQYEHPQKSAIRELVSNGIDAIKEKDIALGILNGTLKEEDYFVRREEALYKDSNFDRAYYDKEWLWAWQGASYAHPFHSMLYGYKPDKVYITYEDGGDIKKDRLLIQDFGTGMGGRRLERYFHMGYSSKRNTIHAIGKFGIGAKAGLAAAPFYTMTTRYNGREYSFNIYPHDIQSIVPEWNTLTGNRNGLHVFENGAKVWYRETILPNGTTIELEAKKHHKQQYIDAVKSQLLYFPNVELRVRNVHGGLDIIPHLATILYEDEHIILSDNNQYSKPHLLIGKINYGNVNFLELELEDKQGNIGIKVAAEDVSIKPSRESVIWDDGTRETIVGAFRRVVNIAEHIVGEQLKKEDFLEWVRACSEVKSRFGGDGIVARLAKIVDLSNVEIPYSKDPTIVYGHKLFMGLNIRLNTLSEEREGSLVRYRITRTGISSVSFNSELPVIIQRGATSFKKDKYLLTEEYPDGFISFQVPFQYEQDHVKISEEVDPKLLRIADLNTPQMKAALEHYKTLKQEVLVEHMEKISNLMQSAAGTIDYDAIVVPEAFDDSEEVTKEDEQYDSEDGQAARKEREKLQREKGIIPIFTPRNTTSSYVVNGPVKYNGKLYEWQKLELPVEDIDKWNEEEVFYATEAKIGKDEDNKDIIEAELLHMAAAITRPLEHIIWEKEQGESKYYRDAKKAPWNFNVDTTIPDYVVARRGSDTCIYAVNRHERERCHNFFGTKVKLIKVAQDRRKFFLDFKPIQRFFLDIKGKTLTMSNALVRWNTARVMNEQFHKLKFLENFGLFHGHASTTYHNIKRYIDHNYRELKDHTKDNRYYGLRDSAYDDLVNHCDKVMKFQLLVRQSKDNPALIAQAAQELFAPQQEINDGLAIDTVFYDSYTELLEYVEPIYVLLNELGKLTIEGAAIPAELEAELEAEIRSYLSYKNVVTK